MAAASVLKTPTTTIDYWAIKPRCYNLECKKAALFYVFHLIWAVGALKARLYVIYNGKLYSIWYPLRFISEELLDKLCSTNGKGKNNEPWFFQSPLAHQSV